MLFRSREPATRAVRTERAAGIAGKEKERAGTVFKNIQLANLKGVPAEQFLDIISFGYSKALGVTCTHCHNDADLLVRRKASKTRRSRDGRDASGDQ